MTRIRTFALGLRMAMIVGLAMPTAGWTLDLDSEKSKHDLVYQEARILIEAKKYQEAIHKLVMAIKLNWANHGARVRLGYCYEMTGDLQKARIAYTELLAVNSGHKYATARLKVLVPGTFHPSFRTNHWQTFFVSSLGGPVSLNNIFPLGADRYSS